MNVNRLNDRGASRTKLVAGEARAHSAGWKTEEVCSVDKEAHREWARRGALVAGAAAIALTVALSSTGHIPNPFARYDTGSFEMTAGDDSKGVIDDIYTTMDKDGLRPQEYNNQSITEAGNEIQGDLGDGTTVKVVHIDTQRDGFGNQFVAYDPNSPES